MPILSIIEETMDIRDTGISWKEIAKAAGMTKSALSHAKTNRTELKFLSLLNIAKFLFNNDYMVVFKEWCLKLHQPMNLRHALEYLAVNRQIDDLEKLLNKIRTQYPSKELLNWVDGYSILAMYLKGNDYITVLSKIRSYTPKSTEMRVLVLLVEIWCRNKMREYNTMNALIQGLDLTIDEIKEDFIRDSYKIRLKEVLAFINLYKFDNKEMARKHAEEIIFLDFSPTFTANASYILGMSYLFDNYDLCLGNILKYRELLKTSERLTEIEIVDNNDIPFINNLWGKNSEQPETYDISEKAHYEATKGNRELAVELLDKAIEDEGLSGFKLYYKAIATNDISLFMQSMIYFVSKKGDKFYANLPYAHLKNDLVYKQMADLLLAD